MIKWTRYSCLLFFVLNAGIVLSQNVLAPSPDKLYVKENSQQPLNVTLDLDHPYYIIDDLLRCGCPFSPKDSCFFKYLSTINRVWGFNTLTEKQKNFIAFTEYYRRYFQKAPINFKECVYFNPAFSGVDYLIANRGYPPNAFRFYSIPIGDIITGSDYTIKLKLKKPLNEIIEPFYFKKAAITNKEYREFIEWVRDSLAHLILANNNLTMIINGMDIDPPFINWKTKINYEDTDVRKQLVNAKLYKNDEERFYQKYELDPRMLNYMYYTLDTIDSTRKSTHSKVLKESKRKSIITKRVINIYPDTLVWINDFPEIGYQEPLKNMYFWHPAYDNYPVVGITKEQAEAYLAWKSQQEQIKLDNQGMGDWIVTYELPNELEWDMVESALKDDNGPVIYPKGYSSICDNSYATDLQFRPNNAIAYLPIHKKDTLRRYRLNIETSNNLYFTWHTREKAKDGYIEKKAGNDFHKRRSLEREFAVFQTLPVDFMACDAMTKKLPYMSSNYDCNQISFMGSNVSEWLQDCYTDFYKPVYDYRHALLEKIGGKDINYKERAG